MNVGNISVLCKFCGVAKLLPLMWVHGWGKVSHSEVGICEDCRKKFFSKGVNKK